MNGDPPTHSDPVSDETSHTPSTQYERVKEIFIEALDMRGPERLDFLNKTCGDDDSLRAAVDALLSEHDEPTTFLHKPVEIPAEIEAAILPDAIGDYRVIGHLGDGATGVVYRAQQANPERDVAIKILRPGLLSQRMLRRFRDEAQVLGLLKHPGIAQILEAGSVNSEYGPQPYLVMELVDGVPISSFVEQRNLEPTEILSLVVAVCEAVHHAHINGVIHRDLKPANILVDDKGQPHILDFGIARVLDDNVATAHTMTREGQVLGTVPYMSPEQVSGNRETVDVRSDVYALGVIMYRLLAGHLPHRLDQCDLVEAARRIREQAPTQLGTIDRNLRGDIETIVSTAMAKEPQRRYQSALALAEDLRRYLTDRPINARPATALYQISKFTKRNQPLVALAALALLLLIGAVVGTGVGLVKARVAGAEANRQAQRAEAVRAFVLEMLAPEVGNRELTVYEAIQWAAEEVDRRFEDDPIIRGDVHAEIAVAYVRLGDNARAEDHARRSLAIRTESLGPTHYDTLNAKNNVASIMLRNMNSNTTAQFEEIRSILAEARRDVQDPQLRRVIVTNQAALAFQLGDLDQAEATLAEVVELMQDEGADAAETDAIRLNLAIVARRRGNYDRSRRELQTIIEDRTRRLTAEHEDTLLARFNLGKTESQAGNHDEAEAIYASVYPGLAKALLPTHREVILLQNERAMNFKRAHRFDEAIQVWENAIKVARTSLGEHDYVTLVMSDSLAITYTRQGRLDEAEALHRHGITSFSDRYGFLDERTQRKRVTFVGFLIHAERIEKAVAEARQLVADVDTLDRPPQWLVDGANIVLGAALLHHGETEPADIILQGTHDSFTTSRRDAYLGDICIEIADLYEGLGRPDDAAQWRALGPPQP